CSVTRSANSGLTVLIPPDSCSYGNSESFGSTTFKAKATCESACESDPVSRSWTIALGQVTGRACEMPVRYSFLGYTGRATVFGTESTIPYVAVGAMATSMSATEGVDAFTDCDGDMWETGLGAWLRFLDLPC